MGGGGGGGGKGGGGGFFGAEQSAEPGILPQFQLIANLLNTLTNSATQASTQTQLPGQFVAQLGAGEQGLVDSLGGQGGNIGSAFATGLQQLQGFATGDLENFTRDLFQPSLDRAFESTAANIREQSALTGTLSDPTTVQNIGRAQSDIEQDLFRILAPLQAQTRIQSANALTALPSSIAGILGLERNVQDLGISRQIQQSQFERGLGVNTIAAIGGPSGVTSFQPSFGPSKFEGLASGLAPLLQAFVQGIGSGGGGGGGARSLGGKSGGAGGAGGGAFGL